MLERPIPRSEIAADPALASMLIIRMPGGGNPFPVEEAQWQAIRWHQPGRLTGQRPARNPPWTRDELLLALDLYLCRRPQLPGDHDPDVQQLSALLNSLPIHTVRPDLERLRNPNGVSLKLANFAAPHLSTLAPGCALAAAWMLRFGTGSPPGRRSLPASWQPSATPLKRCCPQRPKPDDADFEAEEGRLLTRRHVLRERNASLVKRKKKQLRECTAAWRARSAGPTSQPGTATWGWASSKPTTSCRSPPPGMPPRDWLILLWSAPTATAGCTAPNHG
jgi:hypothetical protein